MHLYRTHDCGALSHADIGKEVKLSGWVHRPASRCYAVKGFVSAGALRSLVPRGGLEPPHLSAHEPESCVSTNSTTWAGVCERWGRKWKS